MRVGRKRTTRPVTPRSARRIRGEDEDAQPGDAATDSAPPVDAAPSDTLWSVDFSAASAIAPGNAHTLSSQLGGYLSLTRDTAATVQTSASTLDPTPSNDEARVGSLGTGFQGLVIEEARTNYAPSSQVPGGGPGWESTGASTYTANYAVSSDGVGMASRFVVASGGLSDYVGPTGLAPTILVSVWVRGGAAGSTYNLAFSPNGQPPGGAASGTVGSTWQRVTTQPAGSSSDSFVPVFGESSLAIGGSGAAAHDNVVDYLDIQNGSFMTEAIVSTSGTGAARSGDHLSVVNAAGMLDGGALNFYVQLRPKGGATKYGATTPFLFDFGNGTKAWFDANQDLNVQVNSGTPWFSPTPVAYDALENVELEVLNVGSAILPTIAKIRVASTIISLGQSAAPQGTFTPGTTADVLCSGATNEYSSWVQKISVYRAGKSTF